MSSNEQGASTLHHTIGCTSIEVRAHDGVGWYAEEKMLRVLVLDGYDASRETAARELRRAGYDVIAVEEEEEAVRALDREHVDIVLLDLPLAEAEEAATALRQTARGRTAVVIAIVEPSNSRRRRDEGHANGVDYFFLRPCPPAEIVKHLRRMRR